MVLKTSIANGGRGGAPATGQVPLAVEAPKTYDTDFPEMQGMMEEGPQNPVIAGQEGVAVVHGSHPHLGMEGRDHRPKMMVFLMSLVGGWVALRTARYLGLVQ